MLLAFGDVVVENFQVSAKHYALKTYLQRLLRPVWELNICAVQDDQLISNTCLFAIAYDKINDLYKLMLENGRNFVVSQDGSPEMQQIETIEQESINNLEIFLTRLISLLNLI